MMLINGHLTIMQLRTTSSYELTESLVTSYTCTPLGKGKEKPALVYW